MADPRDLLGKQVIVQNPDVVSARWEGQAIAYTDRPTLLIEQPDGFRLMLPAEWAAPAPSRSTECACGWACRPTDPDIAAEALETHRRHAHPATSAALAAPATKLSSEPA